MTLNEVWELSYDEYVSYLLKKYGPAKYDYFRTPECKSKNPNISRSKEGLECHHIDENRALLLSNPKVAPKYPFEYQKADRLLYADMIEHLLLHHKIAVGTWWGMYSGGTFGCGSQMIIGNINSLFQTTPTGWRLNMFNKIKCFFDVYIEILHRIEHDYKLYDCIPKTITGTIFASAPGMPQPSVIIAAFKDHESEDDYEFE